MFIARRIEANRDEMNSHIDELLAGLGLLMGGFYGPRIKVPSYLKDAEKRSRKKPFTK